MPRPSLVLGAHTQVGKVIPNMILAKKTISPKLKGQGNVGKRSPPMKKSPLRGHQFSLPYIASSASPSMRAPLLATPPMNVARQLPTPPKNSGIRQENAPQSPLISPSTEESKKPVEIPLVSAKEPQKTKIPFDVNLLLDIVARGDSLDNYCFH